eukprot:8771534-Alexandrium_andersonii.AAC.1
MAAALGEPGAGKPRAGSGGGGRPSVWASASTSILLLSGLTIHGPWYWGRRRGAADAAHGPLAAGGGALGTDLLRGAAARGGLRRG